MENISLKNNQEITKFIQKNSENRKFLREAFLKLIQENPRGLVDFPNIHGFIDTTERKEWARKILEMNFEKWKTRIPSLSDLLPNDEIRTRIIDIYPRSPWIIQTTKQSIQHVFPTDFFEKVFPEIEESEFETIFSIFLLLYWHHEIEAFSENIKSALKEKTSNKEIISADLFGEHRKWPGFLCGHAEKNFECALKNNSGFCVVNNNFMAKFFHLKGNPQTLSYLPLDTYKTENDYVIWENYFYGPSDNQHKKVIEAIKDGEKKIEIPNIAMRSIRPTNNWFYHQKFTSAKVRKILQEKWLI